jgi:hypothetical protein
MLGALFLIDATAHFFAFEIGYWNPNSDRLNGITPFQRQSMLQV